MKCCDISAGDLTRSIEVLRKSEVADGMGGVTETWVTTYTPSARIKPVSGRERAYRGGAEASVNYKVAIRFIGDELSFPAITPEDRVKFQGRTFGISYVIDVEDKRRFLEIGVGAAV